MFALKPFIELAIFALVMWAVLSVIYWICRLIDRHISGSYDWFIILIPPSALLLVLVLWH